jgi:hypothetical protein
MGIIYCLTFPNGKKYIGQTTQLLKTRLNQHNAIHKYEQYTCDILLDVKDTELDYYEEKLIKEHNTLVPNGYNIRTGGNSYHGSGYIVRVPGFKSKSFISKKMTDDEKYKLALTYLHNIQYDKRSTTK